MGFKAEEAKAIKEMKEATRAAYEQGRSDEKRRAEGFRYSESFEDAYAAASVIKKYCDNSTCNRCGFHEADRGGGICLVRGVPAFWFGGEAK